MSRDERAVLRGLAGELLELIDVEAPPVPADPLAAVVGITEGEVRRPDDPVLARLFPDAYRDDPAAAEDFRRYTEGELRTGKRDSTRALLASLPSGGGRLVLDEATAVSWLAVLNDLRLALGTRLSVTEDEPEPALDDPRRGPLAVYGWLGWLQETLVETLSS